MGELERQDWREVLAAYPVDQIIAALDRLMKEPPKMNLGDGSVQAYTGRPTVVNVTQTIDQLREEAAERRRQQEWQKRQNEMRELEKRRAEQPEEFIGLGDVLRGFMAEHPEVAATPDRDGAKVPGKTMPTVQEMDANEREALEAKRQKLLNDLAEYNKRRAEKQLAKG